MIKLRRLLESDESNNSDLYDDWYEYLLDMAWDIEKEEIAKIIKRFNLHGKKLLDGHIIRLWDNKQTTYLSFNKSNETYDIIKDIDQWVYDLNDSDYYSYGINPDIIYNTWVEKSLEDFQKNPGKVYHWTTEEKWEEIQQDGKLVGSRGTGINNRGAYGIFTSTDPQEYALGSYGNVCLELDLERYLKESGKPALNLSWEPGVEEYLTREYLRHVLGIENSRDEIENDGGISPYTVVVNEVIPLQYVRHLE